MQFLTDERCPSPDKRGVLSPDNGGTEGGVKTIDLRGGTRGKPYFSETISRISPKRLGFPSHTLGIPVPNVWDFCSIRLGIVVTTASRELLTPCCDEASPLLVPSPTRKNKEGNPRGLGNKAFRRNTTSISEGSEGSEGEFSNFFKKCQNLNSPIHNLVILEKVLKNACLSFGTFGNPIHNPF